MFRRFPIAVIGTLFLMLGLTAWVVIILVSSSPDQGAKIPAEMLANLDDETEFAGYAVRPPKGYFKGEPRGSPVFKSVAWGGKEHDDGSMPHFMIVIAALPSEQPTPELTAFLQEVLDSMKEVSTEWAQTPAEEIDIHGLRFVRCRWTSTRQWRQWKLYGFTAIARDDSKFIQITAQDGDPNDGQAVKIMDAALMTFRRK